jgi:O-antigen/teichoic acid export membrane protein
MIAQFIDTIIIMSVVGTEAAGIFSLGSVVGGLVQAPQRGAIAASIPVLSKAWKDKDFDKINLIYQRSGINLLIASLGIFLLVWLNYVDAVKTFNLKPQYLQSQWIFFFLGLGRIVDLGTGVNSQIIGTSTFWKFEFISGVILLSLVIPLNYILVKKFGIVGAGYSNLIAFTVYNIVRIIFLKRKFNMHPFSIKTAYAIILAILSYAICYYSFLQQHGFVGMIIKSIAFIILYGGGVLFFKLSPDVIPVWKVIQTRTGFKKRPD